MIYDYMYKEVFSNRWLVWFFVISCCVAVGLLGYIQHSFIEMENLNSGNDLVFVHRRDSIRIINPSAYQIVKSPLTVLGEARGTWFFEGDFPIKLLDENNKLIKMAIAKANPPAGGEWMTEDFVSFIARIDFDVKETIHGTIVFQKDNPSGLPEHDFEFSMPIVLSAD